MLIKTYGEYWNPFIVDWDSEKLLGLGDVNKKERKIDFWKAKGIYVLYKDFRAIYVGQAFDGNSSICARLNYHRTHRLAGRWDAFSWYSVCKPNITSGSVNNPKNRPVTLATAVDTLEAISILITDPPLKREKIPGAILFEQPKGVLPKTPKEYMEEHAILLKRVLDRLPPIHNTLPPSPQNKKKKTRKKKLA